MGGNGSPPSRPALRYYGSKWRLAPTIINLFPPHICYAEPFAGSATVLLQKPPSLTEVYNDADQQVVEFFRVLRERTAELVHAVQLTPWSRAEFHLSYLPAEDELERARRFYVRSWQGRAGASSPDNGGWRFDRINSRGKPLLLNWHETEHLWELARRLKMVQLECDDALQVIRRFDAPSTLFYCDPPYLAETRSQRRGKTGYRYEMDEADHRELAILLHSIQGMAIVSHYPCPLYDELYADWPHVEAEVRTENNGPHAKKATECIWISPAAWHTRLPLFQEAPTR
jgi:DNA adenine methylase